ncbi:MAG TPA: 2-oxoglutarate dehydrogenase E1 component, partial [Bacteroidia bacterium]|nr:2-oxoglutarate dehydrogenase E1 component [Bacteroidia bacterium]
QIIIDQYISSAKDKWKRMNGLVMLLPHGYEGQGAEHSSARLERFLALCAENNIQVANCTTPANFFHILRRQIHRKFRKPLVIMTPKSLLRHPKCVSSIKELADGAFKEIINDEGIKSSDVNRIAFCSGKIYYDLLEYREKEKIINVALVRLEQLYPFPVNQINEIIKMYPKAKEIIWVQEEPENMGAWSYILRVWKGTKWSLISRPESASPATGSHVQHEKEQHEIIEKVFAKNK